MSKDIEMTNLKFFTHKSAASNHIANVRQKIQNGYKTIAEKQQILDEYIKNLQEKWQFDFSQEKIADCYKFIGEIKKHIAELQALYDGASANLQANESSSQMRLGTRFDTTAG